MKKFEYKISKQPFSEGEIDWLNEMGNNGWEVVSVRYTNGFFDFFRIRDEFTFKRPLEEEIDITK